MAAWNAARSLALAAGLVLAGSAFAADDWKIDADTFEGLRARALGPGVMSGRIACIDGVSGPRNTLWVGTAGGGVARLDKEGGWQSYSKSSTQGGLPDDNVSALAGGADGALWVGTERGLARLNREGYAAQ